MARPKKIVMEDLDFDQNINDLIDNSKETLKTAPTCCCPQCNQTIDDWPLFKSVVEEAIEYFVKKYGKIQVSSRGLINERRIILSVNGKSSIKRGNGIYYISSSKKSGFGFSISTGDTSYRGSSSAFVRFSLPKTEETNIKRLTIIEDDYYLEIPNDILKFKVNLKITENIKHVLSTVHGTIGIVDFCARLQEVIINDI